MASSSEPFSVIEEEHSTTDLHHHHRQYQQQQDMDQQILSSSISNPRTNKYNQIRQCLTRENDASDQVVVPTTMSLWELRELALTRGGLVSGTFFIGIVADHFNYYVDQLFRAISLVLPGSCLLLL